MLKCFPVSGANWRPWCRMYWTSTAVEQTHFPKEPSGRISKGFWEDYKIILERIASEAVLRSRLQLKKGRKRRWLPSVGSESDFSGTKAEHFEILPGIVRK
ncbi:unnamed protein product [Natator depressus]